MRINISKQNIKISNNICIKVSGGDTQKDPIVDCIS